MASTTSTAAAAAGSTMQEVVDKPTIPTHIADYYTFFNLHGKETEAELSRIQRRLEQLFDPHRYREPAVRHLQQAATELRHAIQQAGTSLRDPTYRSKFLEFREAFDANDRSAGKELKAMAIGAYFATVAVLIIAIMLVRTIEPPWGSIIAATLLVVFLVLTVVLKARKPVAEGFTDEQVWHMYLDHRKRKEAVLELCREAQLVHNQLEGEDDLRIMMAFYGNLHALDEGDESNIDPFIDVTAPMQLLVNRDRLHIPGGRCKAELLGFYDPCPGYPARELRVRWEVRGTFHEVTVGDYEELDIVPPEDEGEAGKPLAVPH